MWSWTTVTFPWHEKILRGIYSVWLVEIINYFCQDLLLMEEADPLITSHRNLDLDVKCSKYNSMNKSFHYKSCWLVLLESCSACKYKG